MDIFHMCGKLHYDLVTENKYYRKLWDSTADWTPEDEKKFKEYLKTITPQGTNESTIAAQ